MKKEMNELTKEINATKTALTKALGREFVLVDDSASKTEKDGRKYSYLLNMGTNSPATRFQTWLTTRTAGVQAWLWIGDAYLGEGDAIQGIDKLKDACKRVKHYNRAGGETLFLVSENVVETVTEFFKANDLINVKEEKKTQQKTQRKTEKRTEKKAK